MNERMQNELNEVRYKRKKTAENPLGNALGNPLENALESINELMIENEKYRRFYINAVRVADQRLDKIKELRERIKELESCI